MDFYTSGLDADEAVHGSTAVGATSKINPADVIAKSDFSDVKTNRQARQLLGIAADFLRQGYAVAETVPTSLWWGVAVRHLDNTAELAKSMRELLDRNRRYVDKIYRTIPDNDGKLTPAHRKQVKVAVTQASSNLKIVSSSKDQVNMRFIDALIEAMKTWIRAVTPKDGFPLWGKVALGAGIVASVWFLVQRFLGGGRVAMRVLNTNTGNPPNWVHPDDIGIWERAVDAVKPDWEDYTNPYTVVTHVYKEMSGRVVPGMSAPDIMTTSHGSPPSTYQYLAPPPAMIRETVRIPYESMADMAERTQSRPRTEVRYLPQRPPPPGRPKKTRRYERS